MNEENVHTLTSGGDDMSLKDLILKGKKYFLVLWGKKFWILLCALLGLGGLYLKDYLTPIKWMARLTFSLNEGDGPSAGSITGLLGQFGLAGTSSGKVSFDKIVELSRSMRIANKALFQKAVVGGKEDYIANHIIDIYKFRKEWSKWDPYMKEFRFNSDHIDSFSIKEKSALKGVYAFTVGGFKPGLIACGYDNKSTIFYISASTLDEDLTLALAKNFYEYLSDFYIQQANDKQRQTYDLIKAKADSLYRRWTGSEYSISREEQTSNGLWSPIDRTGRNIQTKTATIFSVAYGEALKNLEMADYALKNATPFIKPIDIPFLPLDPITPNLLKDLIIGFIMGGGLACTYILGKNILDQALKS